VTSSWAYAIWAVLAASALLVWALSQAASNRRIVARPSAVLARLARDPWLRVPLVVGWAWVGWHLFAR
jgi:Family of unknown function (DUF6186)